MQLVCLADTHSQYRRLEVPEGDVLVFAGDGTIQGSPEETRDFCAWLGELPHPHKVFVPGNHDHFFADKPREARAMLPKDVHCL